MRSLLRLAVVLAAATGLARGGDAPNVISGIAFEDQGAAVLMTVTGARDGRVEALRTVPGRRARRDPGRPRGRLRGEVHHARHLHRLGRRGRDHIPRPSPGAGGGRQREGSP